MKKFTSGISMLALIFTLIFSTTTFAQDPCTPTDQIAENITATSVDVSWGNLTGPTWVRYYETGTQDYKFKFAHESNEAHLHWLTPGTEYTWELNTFCDTAWTDYGWPQTFTTLEDTAFCEPTNQMADNITAHSADLSWEGLEGPAWVRYYPTGTQNYKYKNAHLDNAAQLTWLLAETEYTWEINTLCNGTWTGYDWPQTFTTLEDTVACEPTNQLAENITAHSADLSWEGLEGPAWVRYYPTGSQDYKYKNAHLDNAAQLTWLLAETEYTWEINTLCNGTWTGYDWPQTFTTLEDTVTCEPTNQMAENITAHTTDLSWEGLTGPTWVRYYESGTQEYRYKFAQQNNEVSLNWLAAETEYTWELNTLCNGTWTGYEWPQTFTTLEDTVTCEPTNQMAENITAHSADLSWEGLTGPTWVRYYESGTQEYRYKFAQQNNEVSLHWLAAETEYTWELNTLCNGTWTGYDWPQTFTTLEDTVVCEPTNQMAENITAHSADLSWEGLTGPTWVRYYETGTQEYKYKYAQQNNEVSLVYLASETEYTWELNTLCNGTWTGYDWPQTFSTLEDTVTCEPTNQMAENITAHSADLSWEGLTGLTWVRYYETGSNQYKYKFADTANMVTLVFLHEDTEYTWELNTLCNSMWTGYDWPQTFTTPEDTTSTGCEPENLAATNVTAHSADLSWENIQGPTYVRFYPAGTQDYEYAFTTQLLVTISELLPETDYEWQINNFCQGEWTGYNATGMFTTLPDSVPDYQIADKGNSAYKIATVDENHITGIYAFPNPARDHAQITFASDLDSDYTITVMNMVGSIVFEGKYRSTEGVNNVSIDLRNQSDGIYFVLLRMQQSTGKIKLIKH